MKKYLIVDKSDEGISAHLTNNLMEDFIRKYKISWDEEFEESDVLGVNPIISDVLILTDDCEVAIWRINHSTSKLKLMGDFNFWQVDSSDIVEDFIRDYYKDITMSDMDEKIKRFKDF